jgi:hypothetical protein
MMIVMLTNGKSVVVMPQMLMVKVMAMVNALAVTRVALTIAQAMVSVPSCPYTIPPLCMISVTF